MTTNLKDINFGINQFCGPAVLSALTGENTDRCAAVISAVSGRKEIKAVSKEHLKQALSRLKFDVRSTTFSGGTLFGCLFRMKDHNGLYVLFVPHHVVAVEVRDSQIFICDNHSKSPLDIKQSARLTQRVEDTWEVFPKKIPKFLRSEIFVTKDTFLDRVNIIEKNIYDDESQNTEIQLGYIRYNGLENLELIVKKLKEFVG